MDTLKVFNAGQKKELSNKVCEILGIEPAEAELKEYNNKEKSWDGIEHPRGTDVFIFQSFYGTDGDRLNEVYLLLNGLNSSSPNKMWVVFPFTFGSRAERRTKSKEPINTNVFALNLKANGVYGLLTMDIHTRTTGSIYDVLGMKFHSLEFEPVVAHYFSQIAKENSKYKIALNSPDAGGMERIRYISELMRDNLGVDAGLTMTYKYRPKPGVAEVFGSIGYIKGKIVVINDDIGDTLGTLIGGAKELKKEGARKVYASYVHAMHSNDAEKKLNEAFADGTLEGILVSDTIPLSESIKQNKKVKIISTAPIIAEGIRRIHFNESISKLHSYEEVIKLYKPEELAK